MAGNKTGNGGFDINGKTYTYDVGDPNGPGLDPVPTDKGDISVDNSKKDISKKTKETIGQYLHDKTKQNKYSVDAAIQDFQITSNKGVPTTIAPTKNSESFVDPTDVKFPFKSPTPEVTLGKQTHTLEDPSTEINFSKGKTDPQKIDGNELLSSIQGGKQGDLGASSGYVSKVLSNNRFTAGSPIAPNVNLKHPARDFDPTFEHPQYGAVSALQLAQVGAALSIRASKELNAASAGNNPTSGATEAKAILPGFTQLGSSRVNTRVLEAADVLSTLTDSEVPTSPSTLVDITKGGSWGSMNNVHDPFSGITAIGMIALSVALTAAIVVLFEGFGFLLSLIQGGSTGGAATNDNHRYILGRYTVTQGADPNAFPPNNFPPDIGALLGIRPTVHPFSAALQSGVAAFFGIDTSGGLFGQLTSGLQSATESPGFNAVVARSIIRSGVTVIDSFKNVTTSVNLIAGVKNILGVIDTIRGSKIIAAMNVFANLGDQVLIDELKDETVGIADGGIPEEPTKKSRIDKLADEAGAVQKNRLRGKLKLAWSSNRAPASYLVPDQMLTFSALASGLGGFQTGVGTQDPASRIFYRIMNVAEQQSKGSRIPYDGANDEVTVSNMERLLEAEYMPFYFHDLRTNEIISFHAFIESLSDSFSPSWEQSDGFGRADQVRIYKNTQRKIDISFYVVSTSESDFDDMWVKINKLVTLVYPQYSRGRLLSDESGDNSFIQPFSQLQSASPLIRLRIGDLIMSNYSRFGLARLFGADSNVMRLEGEDIKFENGVESLKKLRDLLVGYTQNPDNKEFMLTLTNLPKDDSAGSVGLQASVPGVTSSGKSPKTAPTFNASVADLPYFVFKASQGNGDYKAACIVTPRLMRRDEMEKFYNMSPQAAWNKHFYLKEEYDNPDKPIKRCVGGKYKVGKEHLRPTLKNLQAAFSKSFTGGVPSVEKLASFLSPDGNSLVKSFKSVQGKGLAGSIDSLSFNWLERTLWEVTPGRRAPQFCKVTLSFTPIHDIAPGLDNNGYNRAPLYPVGTFAPTPDNPKGND